MALGGPSATRGRDAAKGASPFHFLRVLRFARPYFAMLAVGVGCIAMVAVTYSVNIAALLPAVQLIADRQGVPAWVNQSIAERRLDLVLTTDDAQSSIRVAKVKPASSIKGHIKRNDEIEAVDGKVLPPDAIFRDLAYSPDGREVALRVRRAGEPAPLEFRAVPEDISRQDRWFRWGASWLPQETGADARMLTLQLILVGVLSIGIIGAICRFFGEYLIAVVAARTVLNIRKRMYQRVLSLPVSYFATQGGVSDTISRFVADSQDVYRGLNFIFVKSLREPLKAMFVFFVALAIDWRITLITVVSAPLAALLIRRLGKMIRKANRRLLQNYGRMLSTLESAVNGIRVVKGYTMEAYERVRLHTVDREMLRQQLKIERIDALSSPVFETIGQFIAAGAILYFAQQMFDGLMEFSKFATLAACMAAMFDPIRKLSSFYNRVQSANAAMDRVFEIIDLPDETTGSRAGETMPPFAEKIEFRGIRFTYPHGERPALDGINLTLRRGERVAIVGPNGSGKTTLMSLLLRFFEPDEGTILIDGRPIRDYSIPSLRRQMSLLTQDTVIFADTLAANIAYGDDRLLRQLILKRRHPERKYDLAEGQERIRAAAQSAFADEFIREKPQGYDTDVGEHGVTLSGGQKQRIAIARAILRNAPIFIFDEATSQIDSDSEHKIHEAVERFLEGRTALIIAHRFSTILQADRIVVMDRGRIVDVGRHDELIERCGLYQTLYGTQILDDSRSAATTAAAPVVADASP
ncbi:MAG TPA: ABC transporter transmembrane domain-containing protein [Phycisphaerae bacterium]|nr:ABC transporter transmembrane domain-containing protein [Phycisphaerae bacterium]